MNLIEEILKMVRGDSAKARRLERVDRMTTMRNDIVEATLRTQDVIDKSRRRDRELIACLDRVDIALAEIDDMIAGRRPNGADH